MSTPRDPADPAGPAEPLDPTDPDESRVARRSELLPEEEAAGGSEDPEAQAEAILAESDDRTEHPEETGARYTQTSSPRQRPSVD